MPIAALQVENFKRVSAVYIEPTEGVVEITGLNKAGKSSILDAIKAALGGEKQIPWRPIRDGEEEARIEVKVTGVGAAALKITRTFRRREDGEITTKMTVENEDGAKFGSPQSLLNGFLGSFSFDPVAFLEMKPDAQVETLKAFVPDYDFAEEKAKYDDLYDERRIKNRELQATMSTIESVVTVPDGLKPIDEDALIAKLEEAGVHNSEIENRRGRRNAAEGEIVLMEDAIHEKQKRIAEIQTEINTMQAEMQALQYKLDNAPPLPQPIDTTDLRDRISAARDNNRLVAIAAERAAKAENVKALREKIADINARMDGIEAAKKSAIASAKLPIEGLGIDGDIVTFNGLPLDQASQAEQIQISLAIAAAMNPRLKIALVNNGSLLDRVSWAALVEFAEKVGIQVFVETVDSARPTAILIEDGAVDPNG